MPAPKTTREDIVRLLNNNGFGFVVDGELVEGTKQEQLKQALELACECGFLELAQDLHKRGAAIVGNSEPLKAAAEYDRLDVAKFLVANGADINGRSREQGQTALMDAAGAASLRVFQFLTEIGADTMATAEDGSTALDWALSGRNSASIPELHIPEDAVKNYDTIIGTLLADIPNGRRTKP
ncbi:MAG: ankyrin repeat domain-containing protein [Pirellulales bacterium]